MTVAFDVCLPACTLDVCVPACTSAEWAKRSGEARLVAAFCEASP